MKVNIIAQPDIYKTENRICNDYSGKKNDKNMEIFIFLFQMRSNYFLKSLFN